MKEAATVTLWYYGNEFYRENRTEIVTVQGPVTISERQHFDCKMTMVDVFSGLVDFEHDPCRLARFELQLPEIDLFWLPNRLYIKGFMAELTACSWPTKNTSEYGWAYLPKRDKTYRPGLVEVEIRYG